MKKLSLSITPGEQPPAKLLLANVRAELAQLRHKVSGASTAAAGLALVGFVGLQWAPLATILGETAGGVAFVVGLTGFLLGHQYEGVLARRLADVGPIPDNLLAEAAAVANASTLAREYLAGVRAQERELTLAELYALKKLLAATPPDVARESLYGRPGKASANESP